nr:hypothetical protein [Tanacetum cinerariifolium]
MTRVGNGYGIIITNQDRWINTQIEIITKTINRIIKSHVSRDLNPTVPISWWYVTKSDGPAEKKKRAENDWGGSADNNPSKRKRVGLVRELVENGTVGREALVDHKDGLPLDKEDGVTLHFLNIQGAYATYNEKCMRNSGKLRDRSHVSRDLNPTVPISWWYVTKSDGPAEKKKRAENDWGGSADNNPSKRKRVGLVRSADDTVVVG